MSHNWTFLTNHGQALLAVTQDPDLSLRDLATTIDVSERTAHSIVEDLCGTGHLAKRRIGRRNTYSVNFDAVLPGRASGWPTIADLANLG